MSIDPTNVTMEAVKEAMNHPSILRRAMTNSTPQRDPEREAFDRWFNSNADVSDPMPDLLFRAFMAGTAHGLEIAMKRIQEEM